MVVAELFGIAVGMGIAAWRAMRWTLRGREILGFACVGAAAIAALALTLLLAGPLLALTVPTGATLVGFALAFAFSGGGDSGGDGGDDEPPWWPSFEDELRRYERSRVPAGRR
jgi:predicted exporter